MNAPSFESLSDTKIQSLRSCYFFSSCNDEVLLRLVPYFEWLPFNAGQVLIKEGEASDFALVICSGVFEIIKGENTKFSLMSNAKAGSILGEVGLVTGEKRYATCKAVEAGEVGLLSREQFLLMQFRDTDLYSMILAQMTKQLAKRLTEITDIISVLRHKNDIALDAARRILDASARL